MKLEEVESVSRVRDLGQDSTKIGYSKLGFKVYLKSGRTVEVMDNYHYADWAEVKKGLSSLRQEIIDKAEALSGEKIAKPR
ncbi:MAG: hypothetical protein U1B83_01690 [Candidatus Cloacimonadaceae bacterium]|nr:hypothetical protein [Candidatus Cloacimonadaceae bacterium]